jgi:hypothetical protein
MLGPVIRLVLLAVIVLFSSSAQAEFRSAGFQAKATLGCPAGQDWDPRGECWQCPAGSKRTLYPVTGDRACSQSTERLVRATFHHKTGCGAGEFLDPRNGGECWQCPADRPRRTAYPVTDSRACATKEIFGEKLGRATLKGKVGRCTGSQFFDPRNGGECWSCPGSEPRRTLYPVTDARACASKEILGETLSPATFRSKSVPFACPAGQFWDPRNGGECWACPASHPYRTMDAVYEGKACTDKVGEIFLPDPKLLCQLGVGALAAVHKGAQSAQDEVGKVLGLIGDALAPALKPIEKELAKLEGTIRSATELDALLSDIAKHVRNEPVERALRAGDLLRSESDKLLQVLLDEKLICDRGQAATLGARLQALGLGPRPKGASLGEFFVGSAHAATPPTTSGPARRLMFSYSVAAGGTMKSPPIGASLGLSLMTDHKEMHGVYVFVSPQVSSSRNVAGLSAGIMVYPSAALGEFDATALVPSLQLSISTGNKLDTFMKDKGLTAERYIIPDTLDLGMDLAAVAGGGPPSFGIGVSKGWDLTKLLGNKDQKGLELVDFTGSASWSVPLWLQLPPK